METLDSGSQEMAVVASSYCSTNEALRLVTRFSSDRKELLTFVANVDTAFEVIDPHKRDRNHSHFDDIVEGALKEESAIVSCNERYFRVVPKKMDASGIQKYRVVLDFRFLNERTVGNAYPLPNITEILDQLGNSKYFSTLDLYSEFHHILIDEKDKEKTVFSAGGEHMHFN
ncbi:hypothetical protein PR048_015055 [Dryococelus australis]|uniref:Reverse transcriptase domain-containing protein n=1 Tax=Dryococelus australis TaxID=614101 RepID=A0ABQ9HFV9_9NEOP|nr:hypothetical protein PR048_015055 [Dryococelus australis]